MKNCPNCGAPVDLEAKKCAYCGTPYVDFQSLDVGHRLTLKGDYFEKPLYGYIGEMKVDVHDICSDAGRDAFGRIRKDGICAKRVVTIKVMEI